MCHVLQESFGPEILKFVTPEITREILMGIYNDLVFTEALEQVKAIMLTTSSDEITTRLEQIAPQPDLALSCMAVMVMQIKGVDIGLMNGIELAHVQPSIRDLVLPPGVVL